MKTALILYTSNTGNTEKVAQALRQGLEDADIQVTMQKPQTATDVDFFNYDLVCVGTPSLQWHPAKPLDDLMKNKLDHYRKNGQIKPAAPKVIGKNALIFVTYSGPHTGINEATPVGKYLGQFFEHIGFTVLDEWYVVGEFCGNLEHSTKGRLGDIRGKPTEQDLQKIREDAKRIAAQL
jgi:flavodoxin